MDWNESDVVATATTSSGSCTRSSSGPTLSRPSSKERLISCFSTRAVERLSPSAILPARGVFSLKNSRAWSRAYRKTGRLSPTAGAMIDISPRKRLCSWQSEDAMRRNSMLAGRSGRPIGIRRTPRRPRGCTVLAASSCLDLIPTRRRAQSRRLPNDRRPAEIQSLN